jgi:glycosyltransferase involved in cell wall biosynthesis
MSREMTKAAAKTVCAAPEAANARTILPRVILFVHHSNDLYGADIVLLETVKGLDRSRFSPIVVLPEDCRHPGGLAAELEKIQVPFLFGPLAVMRRKYFRPARILGYGVELTRAVRLLARIIRESKVEIVHSNTLSVSAGAIAARLTRTPHVWHIHEMLVRPVAVRRALHFLAPRMSSTVICISEAVRQHVLKDEPAADGKLAVVHNGLPLENFVQVSDGSSIRREFGIPAGAPLIGMVGRINHWKGQSVFVQAARSVLASFPEANFLAVGSVFADEVHYLDRLREEVRQAGIEDRFILSDFRRDVSDILAALDVYVHPALLPEPFGLVVIEAMAAAKPVVATAHGGPLEMIEEGVSGHFVPPADPGALAEKICACLADLRASREMGRRAQERAMRMFPLSRYLDRMQGLYEKALGPA